MIILLIIILILFKDNKQINIENKYIQFVSKQDDKLKTKTYEHERTDNNNDIVDYEFIIVDDSEYDSKDDSEDYTNNDSDLINI